MKISTLSPAELRCESRIDPIGLDTPSPRLSWTLQASTRRQSQAACQVLVASNAALLESGTGDLWDSGREVR